MLSYVLMIIACFACLAVLPYIAIILKMAISTKVVICYHCKNITPFEKDNTSDVCEVCGTRLFLYGIEDPSPTTDKVVVVFVDEKFNPPKITIGGGLGQQYQPREVFTSSFREAVIDTYKTYDMNKCRITTELVINDIPYHVDVSMMMDEIILTIFDFKASDVGFINFPQQFVYEKI